MAIALKLVILMISVLILCLQIHLAIFVTAFFFSLTDLISWFQNLQNSGQIAPLDEIIRLKEEYRFRVLLDESNSFGVLGSSGRGLTEYYGVPVCFERLTNPFFFLSKSKLTQLLFVIDGGLALQIEKIDIVTAAMGHALATEGGFCTGSARVIDHQVCKLYIKGMTFL